MPGVGDVPGDGRVERVNELEVGDDDVIARRIAQGLVKLKELSLTEVCSEAVGQLLSGLWYQGVLTSIEHILKSPKMKEIIWVILPNLLLGTNPCRCPSSICRSVSRSRTSQCPCMRGCTCCPKRARKSRPLYRGSHYWTRRMPCSLGICQWRPPSCTAALCNWQGRSSGSQPWQIRWSY